MKGGLPHGEFLFYYRNGELQEASFYENDKKVGESILYDSLGRVKQKQYFEDGEMVNSGPIREY